MRLKDLFASTKQESLPADNLSEDFTCCGEHEICEKEELLKALQKKVEYYDDEELDSFKGRDSGSYTEEEIVEFTEILHTMWESDVRGWLRSLQIRGIELPDKLKDEVILIINS